MLASENFASPRSLRSASEMPCWMLSNTRPIAPHLPGRNDLANPKGRQAIYAFGQPQSMPGICFTNGLAAAAKRNADDRQEFFNQAMARMLKPIDSQVNFVMMNAHRPAEDVIEHFRKNNILVGRKFPAMSTHVRVSLGKSGEMAEFWQVWDRMGGGMTM